VYYAGQPVLAVIARTREAAQDAAELAAVEYEELPCVVDARRAVSPGAPLVWEAATGNIAAEAAYGDEVSVERAFARAAHVTTLELHNQRIIAMASAPRAAARGGGRGGPAGGGGPPPGVYVDEIFVHGHRVRVGRRKAFRSSVSPALRWSVRGAGARPARRPTARRLTARRLTARRSDSGGRCPAGARRRPSRRGRSLGPSPSTATPPSARRWTPCRRGGPRCGRPSDRSDWR
jgi:hypothetical protein